MSEKLSQLIDQELDQESAHQMLEKMVSDEISVKTWGNYHLIGTIIRGEVTTVGRDVSDRIALALEQEPVIRAPAAMNMTALNAYKTRKNEIWKPIGMFAIAASIVLVAVLTLNPLNNDEINEPQFTQGGDPVPSQEQMFVQEFGEMLVGHGEFSASPGLNGLVSYAKLVSDQRLEQ